MSQTTPARTWLGRFWALPLLVVVGVAIALVIVKSRPAMEHEIAVRQGVAVSTLLLQQHSVRPRVTGYGEVSPDVLLDMRAEVSGRVSFVHPQLKKGAILAAGTLVVRIDARDYRLALKKAQASLVQNRANLAEQGLVLSDAALDLQLAKDKLHLAAAELLRFDQLQAKGTLAQSAVDGQRALLLQVKQEVQSLQNRLDTLPYSTEVLRAQVEIAESEVQTQQLNLARTEIRLPFDARISSLATQADQFVSLGASLFGAQSIDKVLINAQFSLAQMRLLARGFDLSSASMEALFDSSEGDENLIRRLGLSARVRLVGNGRETVWSADVERISSNLDPVSRTVGVIVGIRNPYQQIKPGIKPPLIEGMYMQVELRGQSRPYWVVPRDALHEGELYLLDAEQKLQRLAVSGYPQQQQLLLDPATPLRAHSAVITSDPFPAVTGMQLAPTLDVAAQAALNAWLEAR
ncbi:MAG: hypothetical protein V7629_10020 [Motiliproteus sp.]